METLTSDRTNSSSTRRAAVMRRRARRRRDLGRAAARSGQVRSLRVDGAGEVRPPDGLGRGGRRERRFAVADLRRALNARERALFEAERARAAAAVAVGELRALGMTQNEIAATCGVPRWTVRKLVADAAEAPADPGGDTGGWDLEPTEGAS